MEAKDRASDSDTKETATLKRMPGIYNNYIETKVNTSMDTKDAKLCHHLSLSYIASYVHVLPGYREKWPDLQGTLKVHLRLYN